MCCMLFVACCLPVLARCLRFVVRCLFLCGVSVVVGC